MVVGAFRVYLSAWMIEMNLRTSNHALAVLQQAGNQVRQKKIWKKPDFPVIKRRLNTDGNQAS